MPRIFRQMSFALSLSLILIPMLVGAYTYQDGLRFYAEGSAFPLSMDTSRLAVFYEQAPATNDLTVDTAHGTFTLKYVEKIGPRSYHGTLYRLVGDATLNECNAVVDALLYHPGVVSVSPYLYLYDEQNFRLPTPDILCRLKTDTDLSRLEDFAREHRLDYLGRFGFSSGQYKLRANARTTDNVVSLAAQLVEGGYVEWAHPNFIWRLEKHFTPNDSYFADQWHLDNIGQTSGKVGADMNLTSAWDIEKGDGSIKIAVIDDGVQDDHPDLVNQLLISGSVMQDTLDDDYDPSHESGDSHGTSVAGVAAAQGNNSIGVSGVCQSCKVIPIRLLGSWDGTEQDVADSFDNAVSLGADVINNSWGPLQLGSYIPLPSVIETAISNAVTNGRGGKGCVVLFSAGNSWPLSCDLNGFVESDMTLAVAASDHEDFRSPYSQECDALDFCAPSNNDTVGITTTTVGSTYTNGFGGTSSSCPAASGLAALLLTDEPTLTWQQVRDRMRQGADKIQMHTGGNYQNGHSQAYGYGRLDAYNTLTGVNTFDVPTAAEWGLIMLLLGFSAVLLRRKWSKV